MRLRVCRALANPREAIRPDKLPWLPAFKSTAIPRGTESVGNRDAHTAFTRSPIYSIDWYLLCAHHMPDFVLGTETGSLKCVTFGRENQQYASKQNKQDGVS